MRRNEVVKVGGFQVGDSTMWAGIWVETWSSEGVIESLEVRHHNPAVRMHVRGNNSISGFRNGGYILLVEKSIKHVKTDSRHILSTTLGCRTM